MSEANTYVADIRAERDRLRAMVARVEDEADLTSEEADAADIAAENYRRMGLDADYKRCASLADQARVIADRLRDALSGDLRAETSTDSDPAVTERHGEAGGAGDHV